jgi:hypothetical protein
VTKVYQQSKTTAGRAQIIQYLRPMLVCQSGDCFDFYYDFLVAKKVWRERMRQRSFAIPQTMWRLRSKWNLLNFEFYLKAFVVNGFNKATTFLFVYREARSDNCVALVFERQLYARFFSRHFVCFVGLKLEGGDVFDVRSLPGAE